MGEISSTCCNIFHRLLILHFLGLLILPSATGDLKADGDALLAFLEGLAGASRVTNWSNGTSPCTWSGVGCNAAQDGVESLKLPGVGLYGTIQPGTLGLLNKLQVLSLRSNRLSGPLPSDLTNCIQLKKVFLQSNLLSGSLPPFSLARTAALSTIDLSVNQFSGEIPLSFSSLNLRILRLQNNSLSGSIPPDLSDSFDDLNLSNNNLSGSIPPALQNLPSSSFSGNPALCGPPLQSCALPPLLPPSPNTQPSPNAQPSPSAKNMSSMKLTTLDIVLLIVAGTVSILLLMACCMLCYVRRHVNRLARSVPSLSSLAPGTGADKKKVDKDSPKGSDDSKEEYSSAQEPEHNKLVFFPGGQLNFDLEDLLRASAEVLGKGTFGTAYKAVLEDGAMVVVKRLKEVSVGRKEFEQQMDFVGRLRHPNLVPLRAYYFSKEEKLLVHDYFPLGSLSSLLHGPKKTVLDWETRLKIALGAARGVAYIHGASEKAAHGNIKSANVLVKGEYEACVSDYSLVGLFPGNTSLKRPGPPGIAGYRAPEVDMKKPTQTSDVYSFGVVLLELLTGKAPWLPSLEEGMELVRWVQSVVREEWTSEVFDRELMNYQHIDEEMVQLLQLGLACVTPTPGLRPSMVQVVSTIYDVRPSLQDMDMTSPDQPHRHELISSAEEYSSHESPTLAAQTTSEPRIHSSSVAATRQPA